MLMPLSYQDPLRGNGRKCLKHLVRTSKKYDPNRVFPEKVSGDWKLPLDKLFEFFKGTKNNEWPISWTCRHLTYLNPKFIQLISSCMVLSQRSWPPMRYDVP